MADFAVGQSRMLYGLSMHSERPRHRMYEQWHPLGIVGIISAFNFPVAVWSWNAFVAAVCGDVSVWKPSHHTPLCSIRISIPARFWRARLALGCLSILTGRSRSLATEDTENTEKRARGTTQVNHTTRR